MKQALNEKKLSDCESVVMKIIWDAKEDISISDIIKELKNKYGKEYARTTVVTFIKRLVDKEFATTYRVGREAIVHAEKDEYQYVKNMMKENRDFWFNKSLSNMFSILCRDEAVSHEEIMKLKELINSL